GLIPLKSWFHLVTSCCVQISISSWKFRYAISPENHHSDRPKRRLTKILIQNSSSSKICSGNKIEESTHQWDRLETVRLISGWHGNRPVLNGSFPWSLAQRHNPLMSDTHNVASQQACVGHFMFETVAASFPDVEDLQNGVIHTI